MVAFPVKESTCLIALEEGMNPRMPPLESIGADRVVVEQEIVNGVLPASGSSFEVWTQPSSTRGVAPKKSKGAEVSASALRSVWISST